MDEKSKIRIHNMHLKKEENKRIIALRREKKAQQLKITLAKNEKALEQRKREFHQKQIQSKLRLQKFE